MKKVTYEISSIRIDDEGKEIDRLLIALEDDFNEAVGEFIRFMTEEGHFSEAFIKEVKKRFDKKGAKKTFVSRTCTTNNFHGYLGRGGYELRKVEKEEEA